MGRSHVQRWKGYTMLSKSWNVVHNIMLSLSFNVSLA